MVILMRKRYLEAEKKRYQENRKKLIAYSKKWAKENKEKRSITRKKRYAYLRSIGERPYRPREGPRQPKRHYKMMVFAHYGAHCICCGEDLLQLLTVDHEQNNGHDHKGNGKHRYKGEALYRLLVKLEYPTGIQILCFNCNIGRKNNGGICPHKA
jgi:hypothetical protein